MEKSDKNKTAKAKRGGLRTADRELFIESLATMLSSGMDIPAALAALERETKSSRLKAVATMVREDIDAGSAVWRALERVEIVPRRHLLLIQLGEQAGKLAENLKVVAEQQYKEQQYRTQMRTALMYPTFVLSLTLVVGLIIAWFVLPRLAVVFVGVKVQLPLITRIVIGVGQFLKKYGLIAVPAALLFLGVVIYFLFIFRRTRHIGQAFLFIIPPVRRIMCEAELARLGYLTGSLLNAGISVTEVMDSLRDSTDLNPYRRFYVYAKESLENGDSFQKLFANAPKSDRLFPISTQLIIVSAEQSGRLAESLLHIGETYERKMENSAKSLAVLLEPIMLVIVWIGVAGIAFAVILPIYGLIGGLK